MATAAMLDCVTFASETARVAANVVYRSKRDLWLVALAWGTVLLSLAATAPALTLASPVELAAMLAMVVAVNALVLWVVYGTAYWFDGELLRIRSGPIRLQIPVRQVESVEPTRDARSSPACSLDRLRLRYGQRSVMISPLRREEFLAELQRRSPMLRRIEC